MESGVEVPKKPGPKAGAKYKNRLPPMLLDLRWAYRNVSKPDVVGTDQQENYRRMFKEQPVKFSELLEKLESKYRPTKKDQVKPVVLPVEKPVEEPVDVGSEKALGAAKRWLEEWDKTGVAPPPS